LYFASSYGNVCHNASIGAGVVAIGAPSSKALQLNVRIPKHKVHLVCWQNFFFPFLKKYCGFAKAL
jgi:hypothetical protein